MGIINNQTQTKIEMKTLTLSTLMLLLLAATSCIEEPEEITPGPGPGPNPPRAQVWGCQDPTSFNYNPQATHSDESCVEMFGCLAFTSGMTNSGTIGQTFNDPYIDQKMHEEVTLQRNFFNGNPANVYVLYEPDYSMRNAYANTNFQILFGYHMMYYTIQQYGELAVSGVLAHEWAHIVQYHHGWFDETPTMELEADTWSGFYMAMAKQWAWSQIEGYYQNVYAIGDYNFNHPSHHGTPDQRLHMARKGVDIAIQIMNSGQAKTYEELHALFIGEIQQLRNPVGRLTANFGEVDYPKLTTGEIERLYPR